MEEMYYHLNQKTMVRIWTRTENWLIDSVIQSNNAFTKAGAKMLMAWTLGNDIAKI